MRRILWSINVYNRLDDLRDQIKLIRAGLGKTVDIAVSCNCQEELIGQYEENGEDTFLWFPNTGHHNGTVDALNSVLDVSGQYDFIVSSHADAFLTDPKLLEIILDRMTEGRFSCAYMDTGELGCFGSHDDFGVPLDFFVMTARTYEKVFPVDYGEWAEVQVGCSIRSNIPLDRVMKMSLGSFDRTTDDMIYKDVMGSGIDLVSFHDRSRKLEYMRKNCAYSEVFV